MQQLKTDEECCAQAVLRRLINYLRNGHTLRLMIVKFVIVQTENYKPFKQQCLGNTLNESNHQGGHLAPLKKQGGKTRAVGHGKTALEHMLGWEQFARMHHNALTLFYLYVLIKYRLVAYASEYGNLRYLDCFILGRFNFVGRTNRISTQIGSIFMLAFLIWRTTIHLKVPRFKLFALEFLLNNYDDVLRNELEVCANGTLEITKKGTHRLKLQAGDSHFKDANRRRLGSHQVKVNSIFYLRNHFRLNESKWIMRPNRGSESWLTLNKISMIQFFSFASGVLVWFTVLYWALAGSLMSDLGFEMSYPSCVSWLRDLQSSSNESKDQDNYSYVYLAPKVLAHEIPIDEIPYRIPFNMRDLLQVNLYYIARLSFDLLDNHIIYVEHVLLLLSLFYVILINSLDVVLNANAIKRRLEDLLAKLNAMAGVRCARESKYSKIATSGINYNFLPNSHARDHYKLRYPTEDSYDERLSEEIDNLQAILADHFDSLTRGYNLFASYLIGLLLFIWPGYTMIIFTWMSSIRSRAIEVEFLIFESMATIIVLLLISGAATVRSHNLQLYPLITQAMALDSDWSPSKLRWITILSYYFPRPIYCFTVFGKTEISQSLCLKLASWIISGFILLANYFYMNKL